MATLEKRVKDLEYILAHPPEDLDARFAGVNRRFAETREVLLLHSTRFTKIEGEIADLKSKFTTEITDLKSKFTTEVAELKAKVDLILNLLDQRLPPRG